MPCNTATEGHVRQGKGGTSSSVSRLLPLRMTTSVFGSEQRVARDSLMLECKPNFDSLIWSSRGASTVAVMVELKP